MSSSGKNYLLPTEELNGLRNIRLNIISELEKGLITNEEAINKEAKLVIDWLQYSKIKKLQKRKWIMMVLAGSEARVPNMKPEFLYYNSENECNAGIQNIDKIFGKTLKDMPASFFCKENN